MRCHIIPSGSHLPSSREISLCLGTSKGYSTLPCMYQQTKGSMLVGNYVIMLYPLTQGFSYLSEVGARGLLNLVITHLYHQDWENLMQSIITGTPC